MSLNSFAHSLRRRRTHLEAHTPADDLEVDDAALVQKARRFPDGEDRVHGGGIEHGFHARLRGRDEQHLTPVHFRRTIDFADGERPAVQRFPGDELLQERTKRIGSRDAEAHLVMAVQRLGRPLDELREAIDERGLETVFLGRRMGLCV